MAGLLIGLSRWLIGLMLLITAGLSVLMPLAAPAGSHFPRGSLPRG